MIRHLNHIDINRQKWDECIERSANRLPYAYTWWLDSVCPSWDALILDDYRAVLPLTHERRFGIDYLYQPVYTQQLGVFSPDYLNEEEINSLFGEIPQKYRYIDIQINPEYIPSLADYSVRLRSSFQLDLSHDYVTLLSGYHRNCRRNLQKAGHSGLSVKPGPLPSVFGTFIENNLKDSLENTGRNMFVILPAICESTIQHGIGEILGVYGSTNDLLAAGWFVHDKGKIYFIVCASSPAGKKKQAMYFLVDHVIKMNAGKNILFDFTGSNIPGVAYFNSGFGAAKSTYPAIKVNRLPWFARLFKQ